MLLIVGGPLIASATVFALLVLFVRHERFRGDRLVLQGVRAYADVRVSEVEYWLQQIFTGIGSRFVANNWFALLQRTLRVGQRTFSGFSAPAGRVRRRNRDTARRILRAQDARETETHLTQMASHKRATALTPAQKRKLRKQKLDERF